MSIKREFRECWMCESFQQGVSIEYVGTKCEQCKIVAEMEDHPVVAAFVNYNTDAQWCPSFEAIDRAEIENEIGPDWEGLIDD